MRQTTHAQPMGSPFLDRARRSPAPRRRCGPAARPTCSSGWTGNLVKLNVSTQTLDATNTSPGSARSAGACSRRATTAIFAGDSGGTMWAFDPNNFAGTNRMWRYIVGRRIRSRARPIRGQGEPGAALRHRRREGRRAQAHAGAALTGYPFVPGSTSDAIRTAPLYVERHPASSARRRASCSSSTATTARRGRRSSGSTTSARRKRCPASATTRNVSRYMVATADPATNDGRIYYIDPIADPTQEHSDEMTDLALPNSSASVGFTREALTRSRGCPDRRGRRCTAARAEDWPAPGSTPDTRGCRRSARGRDSRTGAGRRRCGGARVLASPVVGRRLMSYRSISKATCARYAPTTESWSGGWRWGRRCRGRRRWRAVGCSSRRSGTRSWRCGSWTARGLDAGRGRHDAVVADAVNGDLIVAAGFPASTCCGCRAPPARSSGRSPSVMEQFSNTSPAVGGGLVVVGANGGRYYAFDAATGARAGTTSPRASSTWRRR